MSKTFSCRTCIANDNGTQAVKTAASVRNQVLEYFDGLIPIFSDVELFLGNFPDDKNIWNASVDLTITTLDAIERAIGFFISNQCKPPLFSQRTLGRLTCATIHTVVRGGRVLVTGNDYEKRLLDSLDMIQTRSRNLMQEATKSHFFQAHLCTPSPAVLFRVPTYLGILQLMR